MEFKIENGNQIKCIGRKGGTDAIIPGGVTKIGWNTFSQCTSITSVAIM